MPASDSTKKPERLSAGLYDKNYYLHTLPGLDHTEKMDVLDPALPETIRFGRITPGQRILDFGCGRGALVIALARMSCTALGIDFSPDAINFAHEYAKRFPKEIKDRVAFKQMRMEDLNFEAEFDTIFFNQVYEHLYDWELEILLAKFRRALKPGGTLVISTPNLNYIRWLFPLKRISELPLKLIKETLRIFRSKSKHASSIRAFLKEVFKILYPESEHTRLHINLQTPRSIRNLLEHRGFKANV